MAAGRAARKASLPRSCDMPPLRRTRFRWPAPRNAKTGPFGPVSPVAPRRTAVAAAVRPADLSLPCEALLLSGVSYGDGLHLYGVAVKRLGRSCLTAQRVWGCAVPEAAAGLFFRKAADSVGRCRLLDMPTFQISFMRVDRDEDPTVVRSFFRTVEWPALPREGEGLDLGNDCRLSNKGWPRLRSSRCVTQVPEPVSPGYRSRVPGL